jgi:hypothetical protein
MYDMNKLCTNVGLTLKYYFPILSFLLTLIAFYRKTLPRPNLAKILRKMLSVNSRKWILKKCIIIFDVCQLEEFMQNDDDNAFCSFALFENTSCTDGFVTMFSKV